MSINSNENKDKIDLNYNPIYKVNHIISDKIQSIYIFLGNNKKPDNKTDEKELFKNIFTNEDIDYINKNNVNIVYSEQQIHYDDQIGVIKLKILSEMKNLVSLGEIYLFCQKIETLNSVNIYQTLTQNKKINLTQIRLEQFMSNIISDENGILLKKSSIKDLYSFDDILELKLDNKKYIVNNVLGQKFFLLENEYPFICNPFNVKDYDKLIERSARKSLTTLNNHLLLSTGNIINNNIYLCLADDVLNYMNNNNLSQDTALKIYYPFLYNKNIHSLEELDERKIQLLDENNSLLSSKTFNSFKIIDMFYDVFKEKKTDLVYNKKGIKYIKAIIKPEYDIKIPLETIFKIIHATDSNPLIKYNPSSRQENIYRLYTDKISQDGRKIPYLKKSTIFKLMKNIGKTKSVCVFIEYEISNEFQQIICEFEENGNIIISSEFINIIAISEIQNLFIKTINPIIQEVKNYLEQSGYKLNLFSSFGDENIEIKQITYETQIIINKSLNLQKFQYCISNIFNDESNEYKKGNINLRYKRVSNFNKVTSQEAFILEKQEQGYRGEEIIEALLENYPDDLTRDQAIDLLKKIANEIQLERGVRKTDIKIKENPGFKTTITLDKQTNVATLIMENINDFNYLKVIPIYIDSIFRLTQNINSTNYSVETINNLCSKNEIAEDIVIPEIISPIESPISEIEVPIISDDDNIEYKKLNESIGSEEEEKMKNAVSLFFGDDFGEEENIGSEESIESAQFDSSGGKKSSNDNSISSEKSDESNKQISYPNEYSSEESIESEKTQKSIKSPEIESPELISSQESSEKSSKLSFPLSIKNISEKQSEESIISNIPSVSSIKVTEKPESENKKLLIIDSDSEKDSISDKEYETIQGEDEITEKEDEEVIDVDKIKNNEGLEKELDGMSLRNYFQNKIEEYDSPLIMKQKVGNYSTYSKICQSNQKRQPVILTDDELNKINKDFKGFIRPEDVIKYGSDKNKQYNYVCPRYWCLKTNSPVDPKDFKQVVENGKKTLVHPTCGKIIDDDYIKPGHYIYEFYKPTSNNPNYKRYPGFQVDKHPKGYCLPCCFDKYLTVGRVKANNKCTGKVIPEEIKEKQEKEEDKEEDEYIKGPDKFPLKSGRWGYLPIALQKMLHEVNAECQLNKSNSNIKPFHPCLLRHGVEINQKQSFISCISDALFFATKLLDDNNKPTDKYAKILTIKEMKERIIRSLNIDNFIKYQNGNLITDFTDSNKIVEYNKYLDSKLFSKLNFENETDKLFYQKVLSAFENFIDYLNDDDTIIDYTYLWDIVCFPNKYLFGTSGINLIIFEIPEDDITNNVKLICPSNHYTVSFYEARKPSLFLVKKDNFYEPLFSYTASKNKISIVKLFSEFDTQLSKTMRAVLKEIVKPFLDTTCRPLSSMPKVYLFKNPILLYNLVQKLDKYNYKILKIVINYNSKVIGVVAKNPENITGFVPCYPSSINDNLKKDLDYVFITNPDIWNTYENTVKFLTKLETRSKVKRAQAEINCKPIFKIIEDGLVVGVLTETNQFIQLSEPISENEIDPRFNLPSFKDSNYIINKNNRPMVSSDTIITTSNKVDKERVDYINKIKLETNFYNVFRNTIRILLNDYENVKLREKIENELAQDYIIYTEKLKNIDKYLRELGKNKIKFDGDNNFYKLIDNVSTCIIKDKDSCNNTPGLCAYTDNGKCILILPKNNLITNKINETIYYGKMADELIRYNIIRSFILQPQQFISFGNIGYNLRDNEVILLQSILTQEYFETMIPTIINQYVKFNSYDEVQPINTEVYDNRINSLDEAIGRKNIKECTKIENEEIKSNIWRNCFPKDYKEIQYSKFNYCTYIFIIDLIERKTGKKLSVNSLKNILYDEYKKYLDKYSDKIIDILIMEGKKTLGDQVKAESLSFINFIYTDNYFLTTFDLWLLVNKFEIPSFFICHKYLLQTNYKKHIFLGYGDRDDKKFAFIVIPGLRPENVPGYKLILTNNNEVFIPINDLNNSSGECNSKDRNIIGALEDKQTIEEYLENFKKPLTTIYTLKKPVKHSMLSKKSQQLIIEEDESDIDNDKKSEIGINLEKQKRKNLIIEEVTPVTQIAEITSKKTKKNKYETTPKKTKKNIMKRKLLIIDSSTSENKDVN